MRALSKVILLLFTPLPVSAQITQLDVLTSFDPPGGSSPNGNLVQGPDGSFYGTTYSGGPSGVGTIFKVTTNGILTTLVSFDGGNGSWPVGGLTLGNDGNFYSTTGGGPGGNGTVFQVTTNGALTSLASVYQPSAALTLASNGTFYGVTSYGGQYDGGVGTVFNVTTNGNLSTVVSFSYSSGYSPFASVTLGNDGNLYGTTLDGGVNGGGGDGTVFKLTTNGTLTTLVSFTGQNGASPRAGLTRVMMAISMGRLLLVAAMVRELSSK